MPMRARRSVAIWAFRPTVRVWVMVPVVLVFMTSLGTRLHHGERSHGDASPGIFLRTLAPDGAIWYSESRVAPTEPFAMTGKSFSEGC
jgi:hypothetical protein